eukprot:CAMPEP_0117002622 /NCGR_PEP_ID=MMETSP0472-20121206/4225_1 /TAXON_ID=693140 ORGANISM="Tiarina fusus, Strain LIS" /NCGR_SAMPLE_ID=MMETSP0472 /ASSEMBLY_ACC=CAM_ASM_000603 /LENGTH=351 /DNA_ID=CAMNT_0004703021 /DNA_START=93 /DNA_END=1148 /DNA_ORIENTATION=+
MDDETFLLEEWTEPPFKFERDDILNSFGSEDWNELSKELELDLNTADFFLPSSNAQDASLVRENQVLLNMNYHVSTISCSVMFNATFFLPAVAFGVWGVYDPKGTALFKQRKNERKKQMGNTVDVKIRVPGVARGVTAQIFGNGRVMLSGLTSDAFIVPALEKLRKRLIRARHGPTGLPAVQGMEPGSLRFGEPSVNLRKADASVNFPIDLHAAANALSSQFHTSYNPKKYNAMQVTVADQLGACKDLKVAVFHTGSIFGANGGDEAFLRSALCTVVTALNDLRSLVEKPAATPPCPPKCPAKGKAVFKAPAPAAAATVAIVPAPARFMAPVAMASRMVPPKELGLFANVA